MFNNLAVFLFGQNSRLHSDFSTFKMFLANVRVSDRDEHQCVC